MAAHSGRPSWQWWAAALAITGIFSGFVLYDDMRVRARLKEREAEMRTYNAQMQVFVAELDAVMTSLRSDPTLQLLFAAAKEQQRFAGADKKKTP